MKTECPEGHEPIRAEPEPPEASVDPTLARLIVDEVTAFAPPRGSSFSVSQLETYRECGMRWAFQHRLRAPLPEVDPSALPGPGELGSAVHALLEAAGRSRIHGAVDVRRYPKTSRRELLDYAVHLGLGWSAALTEAVFTAIPGLVGIDLSQVTHTEHAMTADLGELDGRSVTCAVVADRVDRLGPEWIEVVDYKTGRAQPLAHLRLAPQTALYMLAARQAFGPTTRITMRYSYVVDRAQVVVPWDDEAVDWGTWAALRSWQRMQEQELPAASPGSNCTRCPYLDRCRDGAYWVRRRTQSNETPAAAWLADLLSNAELAEEFVRAKQDEEDAKHVRLALGERIRERVQAGERDWGAWRVRIARRALAGYDPDCLPDLERHLGIPAQEILRATDGLKKKPTEDLCRHRQGALDALWAHRALDYAQWIEVRPKDEPTTDTEDCE